MKQKGEITVFLTLMLSVISAFIIVLVRTVRTYISECEAAYAVDNAVRSCFAEYNRELFRRFHILLIDSSYKAAENGKDRVTGHFTAYLENSMTENDLCSADITGYRDAGGPDGYIYDCAVRYARDNPGMIRGPRGYSDDEYFLDYLTDVCGNDEIPYEGAQRQGEMEYLLYGFESDAQNIMQARLDHSENGEGDYIDYLESRLELEDVTRLRTRFSELVTEYMRENGSPGFDLSECFYSITFTANVRNRSMKEYSITREYAYDTPGI